MLADFDGITLSGSAVTIISILMGSLVTALVFVFKLYVSAMKDYIRELQERCASLLLISTKAVARLEKEADRRQLALGKKPIPKLIPVEAEHNSPTTERQKNAAEFQSIKARLIAATLILDELE